MAVLEALASTVNRDPTAYQYEFQDDEYLSPRRSAEFTVFLVSQEKGRAAAKYFITSYPKLFTKDYAEPHIPCLMPESVSPALDEVSEAALKERLSLRRVTAAVDMFDQLMQSGVTVSMETAHDLLDLISFYGDRDPVGEGMLGEGMPGQDDTEEVETTKKYKSRFRKSTEAKVLWRENNNAERIFNLLPERDTRCYSALIRGMVKYGAFSRAFSFYADLLNNRLPGDVHIFNALISVTAEVRDTHPERWVLINELLGQMKDQKVQPTLLTFNSVLKSLRRCGFLAKIYGPRTLNEMKALGIAPSLASYDHLLFGFFKQSEDSPSRADVLQQLMLKMEGTSFTCRDPDDVMFFCAAMKICLDTKDLELAYKVHSLVETGENWKLLGDPYQQSIYYGRFFTLLCQMEHLDVVLKWYRRLIPSMYYPNLQGLKDLFQAIDTDSRLDLLPTIWKDICTLGHDNKLDLVEDLLGLMSRDEQSPEVQQKFAECALQVKSVFEGDKARAPTWSAAALGHVTALLLRTEKTQQQAWETLQLFKAENRVPTAELLEEFLTSFVSSGSSDRAVELVRISASFCLPCTNTLAERAARELSLSEEQRSILSELELAAESSE